MQDLVLFHLGGAGRIAAQPRRLGQRIEDLFRRLLGQRLPPLQQRPTDPELPTQLRQRELPPLHPGELLPLKLRRIHPPAIGLPSVLLHGPTLRCE